MPDPSSADRSAQAAQTTMGRMDEWRAKRKVTLEISGPTAECGACGFTAAVTGEWSIEDGRLVFRADADPLTRRGPSLTFCSEGREATEFEYLEVDGREVAVEEFAAIRATAEASRG